MKTNHLFLKSAVLIIFIVAFHFSAFCQITQLNNNFIPNAFVGWNLSGGTNPLNFRTNNVPRMTILGTNGNVGIGTGTPGQLLTVSGGNIDIATSSTNGYSLGGFVYMKNRGDTSNIFLGFASGGVNTGVQNTFCGKFSGQNNSTGSRNTFVGWFAGRANDGSNDNTFIGYYSGRRNFVGGIQNTFLGSNSGFNNTAGFENTYLGYRSGFAGTGASVLYNVFVGSQAGENNQSKENTFVGRQSGFSNVIGGENAFLGAYTGFNNDAYANTFIGYQAGRTNTTGFSNTFIGDNAGFTINMTGSKLTLLGQSSNVSVDGLMNATAIGVGAVVTQSNTLILGGLGNTLLPNIKVGIGLSGDAPLNMLEINADPNFFTYTGTGGSGLKFRQLNETSTFINNNATNTVLSVDLTGNVILVKDNTGFYACNPTVPITADDLPYDSWWQLNGFNFIFDGNGTNTNQNSVGIGIPTCTPTAKLDVLQNSNATTLSTIGIKIENQDNGLCSPSRPVIGIKSFLPGSTALSNNAKIAGWFEATPDADCFGITQQCAIFAPLDGGRVSIGYPTAFGNTNTLVEINGDLFVTGVTFSVGGFVSDEQLKTNINPYTNGLDVLRQINPITFNFNGLANTPIGRTHIGVKAQDIQLIPEIADYTIDTIQLKLNPSDQNMTNILTVDPNAFVYTLINAVKQLDSTVTSLQEQLQNNNLRTSNPDPNTNPTTQKDVTLSNKKIVLNQNQPNPFKEQTTITYEIKTDFSNAMIIFTDMLGQVINEVTITEKGKGQLNVYASDLSSGIYTYTIVVDGITIDTKKMVKQN